MQITRWRNFLSMKNHIIPSLSQFSAFHSTPCSCHKSNTNPNQFKYAAQKKNQIKYITRQKRADTKKALKNLLYNSGSSRFSFEDKQTKWKHDGNSDDRSNSYSNTGQPKSSQRFGGKSQKKTKRKIRRESFCEEDIDGNPEQVFHATFGNRSYTWSFSKMRGSSSEDSTYGFEWKEQTNRTNTNKWKTISDDEYDDNDTDKYNGSCFVGSSSDRTILGLPPTGPLKIEDVKNAFRLSALKWHPDKHQGPSQAIAEEKFKLCLNAYKTLCNALSPT